MTRGEKIAASIVLIVHVFVEGQINGREYDWVAIGDAQRTLAAAIDDDGSKAGD